MNSAMLKAPGTTAQRPATPNAPDATASASDTDRYGVHTLDPVIMQMYDEGLVKADMPEHAWRRPRFFHLVQMLRLTHGLPGETAEAGCFRGLSSYMLCREVRRVDPKFDGSTHTIVDSFEGLSEPVECDGEHARATFTRRGFTTTSVEHVRSTLSDFPGARMHKGWIPRVFSELPDRRYRFAHIDVDLYEPTLASLRYFVPRLVPGGIVVIDDYGPWPGEKWLGCAKAVHEFSAESGLPFCSLDTGNAVFIKR